MCSFDCVWKAFGGVVMLKQEREKHKVRRTLSFKIIKEIIKLPLIGTKRRSPHIKKSTHVVFGSLQGDFHGAEVRRIAEVWPTRP